MLNFSIISLISFVLIYQNIILLNEETLILLCFITFCWLAFNRLKESTHSNLSEVSTKTQTSLVNSLNQLSKVLNHNANLLTSSKNLATSFGTFEKHFSKFNLILSDKLPLYLTKISEEAYPKKLLFTQRLEQQTTKLLSLIISQKLVSIASMNEFYTHEIKVPVFLCKFNISLREYIKIV